MPAKLSAKLPAKLSAWPEDIQSLIDWFLSTDPPAEAFDLQPGVRVVSPERFWVGIKLAIGEGPEGPRARYGALQKDLAAIKAALTKQ